MAAGTVCRQQASLIKKNIPLPTIPPLPAPHRFLEAAEGLFLSSQVKQASHFFPDNKFAAIPFRTGSVAGVTKKSFAWKLNRVAGLGMSGPVSKDDLWDIERMYQEIGMTPYIDLCPLAHPSARALLRGSGYDVCGEVNVHTLPLRGWEFEYEKEQRKEKESEQTIKRRVEVSCISNETDRRAFVESSIAGFGCGGDGLELLRTLAQCAVLDPETCVYLARIDGQVAGGAGLVFLDTPFGRVAEAYISSTVPGFQGRGVQTALLKRRLADAKKNGIDLAIVNTRPGTASARNVGRMGFRLEYTRETFSKSGD